MRVYCVFIVFISQSGNYKIVESAFDGSDFFFFQRLNVRQIFYDTGEKLAISLVEEHDRPVGKITWMENGPYRYCALVAPRRDYVSVVVTSDDYSDMAAKALLNLALQSLIESPEIQLRLEELLVEAQDPVQFDRFMQIQRDLQETVVTVHSTIQGLAERGDKLEEIEAQSRKLHTGSKLLSRRARIRTSCWWAGLYATQDWVYSWMPQRDPLKDHEKGES